jgi:benzoyl-CoA reductase/2-hydroxyglutaryl-CoA dehydratase subunit BcrC/BadD/HgdB
MMVAPAKIDLAQWDRRYDELKTGGLDEPWYGGPLGRHLRDGDTRLRKLVFDNSPAALRLWNFLMTENDRLAQARQNRTKLVGTMKDLGTVPVMAYSLPNVVAFYPDGAWWIPCVMEGNTQLLEIADRLGIDESFCPVRAMLGAFVTCEHFPRPDLLICSTGAVCDDFSTIAQRLGSLGFAMEWWEVPHRRHPESDEDAIDLPGGLIAPKSQVDFVAGQFDRIKSLLEDVSGRPLTEEMLADGIRQANRVRGLLRELRESAYTAAPCPLPGLEMLIAEMLAIHFCSDRSETIRVLEDLLAEVRRRTADRVGVLSPDAVRVFWVNPVADLRAVNIAEDCGARICGTEYLFNHALELIPETLPPLEALARMVMADPMVGSAKDRAELICRNIERFGAEAVIISRIPGASHCALEGEIIRDVIHRQLGIPVLEIELPSLADAMQPALKNRISALVESVRQRRKA